MRVSSLVFCFVIVFRPSLEAQTQAPPLDRRAQQRLLREAAAKPIDERIALYSKLSSEQPRNAQLRALLALDYLQKTRETGDGKYVELASKIVDKMLAEDREDAQALRIKNEIGLRHHLFRQVAEDARLLTSVYPSDRGSWGNLGDALMEVGEIEEAGKAFERMTALRPDLTSYSRAAYYAFVTGKAEGAISLMKLAIAAGSRSPEPLAWSWAELGDLYFKTGALKEAHAAYESAVKLYPGLPRAHAGLGHLLWAEGRLPEATASYKRALAILPLPEYAAALEELYRAQGNRQEAGNQRKLFDAIASVAAASGEKANRVVALSYVDQNRNLDAALKLVEAEFENRGDVYSYDALGWVLHKLKRNKEAEEAAAKAVKLGTPEPLFYFHAGMIAAELGKTAEAKRHLGRALELNPKFHPTQALLAKKTLAAMNAASATR